MCLQQQQHREKKQREIIRQREADREIMCLFKNDFGAIKAKIIKGTFFALALPKVMHGI